MRIILAVVGMIGFCIGLLLLALELIRIRKSTVKLRDGSGELVMNGVAGHLAYYVDLLPDVLRAKPQVKSTGKGVRTTLYVETAPGINVPEKSSEISQTARQVLEEQLGLQVKGDIRVVIKPVALPRPRQGKRPPVVAVPKPTPAPAVTPQPRPVVEPIAPPIKDMVTPEPLPEMEDGDSEVIEVKAPPES
jgi:uncharacterized alkaline shock family protein YloU